MNLKHKHSSPTMIQVGEHTYHKSSWICSHRTNQMDLDWEM